MGCIKIPRKKKTDENENQPVEAEPTEVEEPQPPEATEETTVEEVPTPPPTVPTAKFALSLKRSALESFLGVIGTITDEPVFKVDAEGLSLRQMDASRVAMVDFQYGYHNLEGYLTAEEGFVCFNLGELMKIVKTAGKDDVINIESDLDNSRLNITIEGEYVRTFTLPILEAYEQEVPIPKMNHTAHVVITAGGLGNIVRDAQIVADHMKITATPEAVHFRANGDLMSVKADLKKGDLLDLDVAGEVKATYSLGYFESFLKAVGRDTVVRIDYAQDVPVKIDVSNGLGKVVYYLAPRIEVD